MNRPRFEVPAQLRNLLLDFTVSVLVNRPTDLVDYAASYFADLRDDRRINSQGINAQPTITVENDDSGHGEDFDRPKLPNTYSRRKSVFAEQYDPEQDDDDDTERLVYPKTDEQRQRLTQAINNILLFRSLDKSQMQEVIDAMFERKVQAKELVIRQNDDGDNFYVIERGRYNVFVNNGQDDVLVSSYDSKGSFGELALMYNTPRAATIEAVTNGSLWAMNRQTFRRIVLKSAFKKRKEYEALLENVPMLQSLNPYERMNLCDALMPKSYNDSDLIIKQGEEADGMFFIEEGTVRIAIRNENDGTEGEVSRLSSGSYFGELALVTHKPRAASVCAVGDVKLAFLDVQAFERLLGPCMDIMKRNIDKYEEELEKLFGSKSAVSDLR